MADVGPAIPHDEPAPARVESRLKRLRKRGPLRDGPELVMDAAHPLHPLIDLPGHFAKRLVVLAGAREQRIRARLTIRVA